MDFVNKNYCKNMESKSRNNEPWESQHFSSHGDHVMAIAHDLAIFKKVYELYYILKWIQIHRPVMYRHILILIIIHAWNYLSFKTFQSLPPISFAAKKLTRRPNLAESLLTIRNGPKCIVLWIFRNSMKFRNSRINNEKIVRKPQIRNLQRMRAQIGMI